MDDIDVIHHFKELDLSLTDLLDRFISIALFELFDCHYVRRLDQTKRKERQKYLSRCSLCSLL